MYVMQRSGLKWFAWLSLPCSIIGVGGGISGEESDLKWRLIWENTMTLHY